MTSPRMATAIPAALLALALAGPALAGTPPKPAAAPARAQRPAAEVTRRTAPAAKPALAAAPAPAATLPAGTAGMVVGIDPETGVLGPATAEQRLELLQLLPEEQNMLSRSTVGLVERRLPDGGVLLDLGGRFQEFSYVRMTPGGRYVFGCANDPGMLRRGLTGTAKQPAVLEER